MSKLVCAKNIIDRFKNIIGDFVQLNDVHRLLARYGCKPVYIDPKRGPMYRYDSGDNYEIKSVDNVLNDIFWDIKDGNFVFDYPKETQADKDAKVGQMQIPFVDESDDKLYENMFGKKVYFTESQIQHIKKNLLCEEHLITKIIQSCTDNDEYIKNDFDEKWKRIPEKSDFFKKIKEKMTFENKSKLSLYALAEVESNEDDDKRYIGIIFGGLNGSGEWKNYLKDIATAFSKVDGYLVDLDNDVCDDVWTLIFGFYKEKLNEGACGFKPEDSDNYFDTCYALSEKIFNGLLKDLNKSYKEKNDNMIYTYLGILNHMLTVDELRGPIYYTDKDLEKGKTEGNDLALRIIKTGVKCYKYLQNDKENRQGWSDFEEYDMELYRQYETFKDIMKTFNTNANVNVRCLKSYHLTESQNFIEPQKVLLVKRFLDDTFVRGNIPYVGDDGYPKTKPIVGMKGTDGKVAKNMDAQHLFYLLQDKFKGIYSDKERRDKFLKQVMKDWYDRKITREGLLSVNKY